MPLPAAVAAAAPLLAKVPPALKALYASKHFWPIMLGGTFLGQEALGQLGKAGERGVAREQIALQRLTARAQSEAAKRAIKESRTQTKEYMKELTKARREEAKQAREQALMESFVGSQDRQLAMILSALQGVAQTTPTTGVQPARAGMVNLMRSSL